MSFEGHEFVTLSLCSQFLYMSYCSETNVLLAGQELDHITSKHRPCLDVRKICLFNAL
jgi:hypothetical protein